MTERYYGVSTGNGNDGVSHLFPDYICKTDAPYKLAELAALTEFKPDYHEWAKENVEIDGDADYTISAVFLESPETQEERQALFDRAQEIRDAIDDAEDEDKAQEMEDEAQALEDDAESFGNDYAWHIIEVFPWNPTPAGSAPGAQDTVEDARCPVYDSLAECFGDAVALVEAAS